MRYSVNGLLSQYPEVGHGIGGQLVILPQRISCYTNLCCEHSCIGVRHVYGDSPMVKFAFIDLRKRNSQLKLIEYIRLVLFRENARPL